MMLYRRVAVFGSRPIGGLGRAEQGTALIVTLTVAMVFTMLLAAMITLHALRDRSEMRGAERLSRMYAVEAGLERAKLEVKSQAGWLSGTVPEPVES